MNAILDFNNGYDEGYGVGYELGVQFAVTGVDKSVDPVKDDTSEDIISLGFATYSVEALDYAAYPEDTGLLYSVLGLCSEAGEVADKVKKHVRDGGDYDKLRMGIQKELGDILWYCAAVAREYELNFATIPIVNLEKLASRKDRGVINGSGDDR